MNPADVLFAIIFLLCAVNTGALILGWFLRQQDQARVKEVTTLVLALADEFRARTGTEIRVDRGLLEDKPDVLVGDHPVDGEDWSMAPDVGAWSVKE